jgi:hypothetical protein
VVSIDQVSTAGFSDPTTIDELRRTRRESVPRRTGVYLFARDAESAPKFRILSTGGWFNGLDPNCPLDVIQAKWMADAHIVYVG